MTDQDRAKAHDSGITHRPEIASTTLIKTAYQQATLHLLSLTPASLFPGLKQQIKDKRFKANKSKHQCGIQSFFHYDIGKNIQAAEAMYTMREFHSLVWVQLYEHSPTSAYTFDEFSLGEKEHHEAEFDEQRFQNSISYHGYVTTKSADLRKASNDKRQMNRPELVKLSVKVLHDL